MMNKINVLINLHRGYGLGDAVQQSAVLRHIVKYRPHWNIDFQAEEGRYCIGNGIVDNTFEFGNNPNPNKHYDAEVEILLFDTWANWHNRPNTRVSSCLHERFGLGWDIECSRYQINVSNDALEMAGGLISSNNMVAVHYMGDSSPIKKNLTHKQASEICYYIENLNHIPVIFDWRNKSPLDCRKIVSPTKWGGNAEMVCALILQCKAFVGIDSGPSKCASATDIPALVVWTGHHPSQFHDPAPNTTHLVPQGYHGLEPVCNDPGVIKFFEENYTVRKYEYDPVSEVKKWLREVIV